MGHKPGRPMVSTDNDIAALEGQMSELKIKKAAALESEDYDAAKEIKGAIESLTAQIERCQTNSKAQEEAAPQQETQEPAMKAAEEEPAAAVDAVEKVEETLAELENTQATSAEADDNKARSSQVDLPDACSNNRLEEVRLVCEWEPERVNTPNDAYGYTPLHWACLDNFEEAVVLLLDAKAEVTKRKDLEQAHCIGLPRTTQLKQPSYCWPPMRSWTNRIRRNSVQYTGLQRTTLQSRWSSCWLPKHL